jgi:hypothetical protein
MNIGKLIVQQIPGSRQPKKLFFGCIFNYLARLWR